MTTSLGPSVSIHPFPTSGCFRSLLVGFDSVEVFRLLLWRCDDRGKGGLILLVARLAFVGKIAARLEKFVPILVLYGQQQSQGRVRFTLCELCPVRLLGPSGIIRSGSADQNHVSSRGQS